MDLCHPLQKLLPVRLVLLPTGDGREFVAHARREARKMAVTVEKRTNDVPCEGMVPTTEPMLEVPAKPMPLLEHHRSKEVAIELPSSVIPPTSSRPTTLAFTSEQARSEGDRA